MNEAAYRGNLGMMEVMKFMDLATPEQKDELRRLLEQNKTKEAAKLIQSVTKTELEPLVPEKNNPPILMAFDFDNTLVTSKSKVHIRHQDGTVTTLDPYQYAQYVKQPGDVPDYSEFSQLIEPEAIEKYQRILKASIRNPNVDVVIVTARGNEQPLIEYLRSIGIESGVKIKTLNSSKPMAKYRYLKNKIAKGGYRNVAFFDDSEANTQVVAQLGKDFPGVMVHTHTVPQQQYRPEKPVAQDSTTKILNQKIRNPETDNEILLKTALKYPKEHPAYQLARRVLARDLRKQQQSTV